MRGAYFLFASTEWTFHFSQNSFWTKGINYTSVLSNTQFFTLLRQSLKQYIFGKLLPVMDDFLTFWGEVDQYLQWGEGINSSLKMSQLDQIYPFLHLFADEWPKNLNFRAIASDAQNLGDSNSPNFVGSCFFS